ncbi:tyrosine-type recombinase/integrase [Methylobacterium sp. E-045]|uniref:tyrosine-type recombinase/integrase n=1 Tax=Methylobacterium sp. E-045 TaxID=2836575 RepID=UPI001FBA78D5|nr:tyrosine-type recombinase/integrase [Methylobacterium sp. E-045]MCJ2132220.1 tyrosine-type recombinase/integrase [Methylobacterium sp. E-045]
MSRPSKGARLYAQAERRDPRTGELLERAIWVIRDGGTKRSTGVPVTDDRRAPPEAEQAFSRYLAEKHTPPREGHRPLAAIPLADVINIYLTDCADRQARPKEVAQRARALLTFWGTKSLAQVNGDSCRAYVEEGGTRRQLEDLRAAIEHHLSEGYHREIVRVVLPEKGQSRERWLTRAEAARLVWAAYRYREIQKGHETDKRTRRHVARFILIALYTGTRAGAICAASFTPTEGRGWINLDTGVFYRRPSGERETNKRKAPVRLPDGLLAHLRRWHRKGLCRNHPVEWQGRPVKDVDKAFRHARADAGLSDDVTPHVLKHTAVTWAMHHGVSKEEAASFFSTTVDTIERVYWHHHPDFQREAAKRMGRRPRQKPDRNDRNDREQAGTNEGNVVDFSKAG